VIPDGEILGVITPTVRVSSVALADETEVVAVIAAGSSLAEAAVRAWDEGRAILPLNPAFTPTEVTTLLERLRPTSVVDAGGDSVPFPGGVPAAAGTAAIVVTSGTSGLPKGVELTRSGMEVMGRGYSDGLDAATTDRWLACLPLHHVTCHVPGSRSTTNVRNIVARSAATVGHPR
jgi:long-subunit acyl-CoA synthetase (AMP-forming)